MLFIVSIYVSWLENIIFIVTFKMCDRVKKQQLSLSYTENVCQVLSHGFTLVAMVSALILRSRP